jgi:hypothetical protein
VFESSLAGWRAVGLGAAGIILAAPFILGSWAATQAAPTDPADATLIQLTNSQVDAIGMDAYTGTYGRAVSTGPNQTDSGDFSDPDGVLSRVTIATMITQTSTAPSKNYAQAQLTALNVTFNSQSLLAVGPVDAGGVGTLDSYAECVPPPIGPLALAYNRTDASQITVFGRRVDVGTTVVPITGVDLGVPSVGPSTLTVVVTRHQEPAAQAAQLSASAWLDVEISGMFTDLAGAEVYTGPVSTVRLGEVHANCTGASPAPTSSASPSASPSPSASATVSPTVSPTPSPTVSPTAQPTGSPLPTPSVTPAPTTSDSPAPVPPPPAHGGGLPDTGLGPLLWTVVAGVLLVLGGTIIAHAAR